MHSKRQNSDAICLSITRSDHIGEGENVELKAIERQQLVAFTQFSAKRSAGRVERYFVKVRSKRAVAAIIAVGIVLAILGFFFAFDRMSVRSATRFQEIALSMMQSTKTNIFYSVTNMFYQTHYFGIMLADLMRRPNGLFDIGVDTAANATQLFYTALTVSQDVSQYGLGLNTGAFIACQAEKGGVNAKLIFANTTKDFVNPEQVWIADEQGVNESYPWSGGVEIGSDMNATARMWYQLAVQMNESLWTSIYYGLGTLEDVCVVSEVTPIWDARKNEVSAVIKAEVELTSIDRILNASLPSNMSRFAIANDRRELVSVSGNSSAVDFYRGEIVTRTLQQLVDPVWTAVTQSPEWSQGNFTLEATIDGEKMLFAVAQVPFEPAPGVVWMFYSVLCMTDILQQEMSVSWNVLYFVVLLFSVAMITMILVVCCLDRSVHNEKTRMLTNKHGEDERHVKPVGAIQGINSLKKLIRSHGDRDEVLSHIKSAIVALSCFSTDLFFDRSGFYSTIEDKRLVKRLTKIYGGFEQANQEAVETFTDTFTVRGARRESTSTSNTSIGIILSPVAQQAFMERSKTLKRHPSEATNLIAQMIVEHNTIFDQEKLVMYLTELCHALDETDRILLLDSIEFAHITFKWRVALMLASDHEVLPVLIALVIWRLHMQSFERDPELIHRYFNEDPYELLRVGREKLVRLFKILLPNQLDQWAGFSAIVMEVLNSATLEQQFAVMTMSRISSAGLVRDGRNEAIRSLVLCKMVFIAGTVSYVFHGPDTSRYCHRFINKDFEVREHEIGVFVRCMFDEYIQPLIEALGEMCGRSFMKKFHEGIEVSSSLATKSPRRSTFSSG